MARIHLFATAAIAVTCTSALAAPETLQLHEAKTKATFQEKSIPDAPLTGNSGFGAAVEDALGRRAAGSVTDPTGKFAVQVIPDGNGQTIRLLTRGTNQAREWRLGSGAGERVLGATITEIMEATGQQGSPQLTSAFAPRAFSGKKN